MTKRKQKIAISTIEIEIGDTTQKLTLEQAKELRDILNETFPEETVKHIHHDHWWSRNYFDPPLIQPIRRTYWTTEWSDSNTGSFSSGNLLISSNNVNDTIPKSGADQITC